LPKAHDGSSMDCRSSSGAMSSNEVVITGSLC
jgi:hypothetical protein